MSPLTTSTGPAWEAATLSACRGVGPFEFRRPTRYWTRICEVIAGDSRVHRLCITLRANRDHSFQHRVGHDAGSLAAAITNGAQWLIGSLPTHYSYQPFGGSPCRSALVSASCWTRCQNTGEGVRFRDSH
jgi:hypothetical protein